MQTKRYNPIVIPSLRIALCALALITRAAGAEPPPNIAPLLEDNAAELLAKLTNPTGDPGQGFVETDDVFSGSAAIKVVPMQRFEPRIAGWNYKIAEHPARGEYRYVRFAWRTEACAGVMLRLHNTDWNIRYVAGTNEPGWGAKQVADKAPARWMVVTRDLFADFGESTMTGIALTAFGHDPKSAAWFDHVYFGRTVADLDRIDATGDHVGEKPLDERSFARTWSDDAPAAYRARCRILRDGEHAVPFLKQSATNTSAAELSQQIGRWIDDLGAEDPAARRTAARGLALHMDAAAGLLRLASADDASPEVRAGAAELLHGKDDRGPWPDAAEEAVRLLRLIDGKRAQQALSSLADGSAGPRGRNWQKGR